MNTRATRLELMTESFKIFRRFFCWSLWTLSCLRARTREDRWARARTSCPEYFRFWQILLQKDFARCARQSARDLSRRREESGRDRAWAEQRTRAVHRGASGNKAASSSEQNAMCSSRL